MATQRYSVTPHPIETLLTWVKSGEIAIPEIQRPFVWEATKVRNLLDSLYRGYPVGYLITWRNPNMKLKDGTSSAGKRILIDGQQRVTALMASLLGHEVLTKDYETIRIRIAFHPQEERFEVANPAIRRDAAWIQDVADVFAPDARSSRMTTPSGILTLTANASRAYWKSFGRSSTTMSASSSWRKTSILRRSPRSLSVSIRPEKSFPRLILPCRRSP